MAEEVALMKQLGLPLEQVAPTKAPAADDSGRDDDEEVDRAAA
jgi:hypothetical protein